MNAVRMGKKSVPGALAPEHTWRCRAHRYSIHLACERRHAPMSELAGKFTTSTGADTRARLHPAFASWPQERKPQYSASRSRPMQVRLRWWWAGYSF